MPYVFPDTLIVALYKIREANCRNFRGMSLSYPLCYPLEARSLLAFPWTDLALSERNVPGAQCDFHPEWSTADMLSIVRQVQHTYIRQNKPLYSVFVDLTLDGEVSWIILRCYGCQSKFVKLIQLLHNRMIGHVLYRTGLCASLNPDWMALFGLCWWKHEQVLPQSFKKPSLLMTVYSWCTKRAIYSCYWTNMQMLLCSLARYQPK